jgi:hypothetical protein
MEEGGRGLTDDPSWEDDDVAADDDDVAAVDVVNGWEVTEVSGGGCGFGTGAGCILSRRVSLIEVAVTPTELCPIRGVLRSGLGGDVCGLAGRDFCRRWLRAMRRDLHSSGVLPWASGQPEGAKCMA